MKITKGIVLTLAVIASAIQAYAIEGLKLSVRCSNVVLSWPSTDTNNEYYIVQYRPTLSVTDRWQTLAMDLPADTGTNRTTFVHSNVVIYPVCNGGSFSMMSLQGGALLMDDSEQTLGVIPLAVRNDGSGTAAPVALYPPGFDFSAFTILDPTTGETSAGSGYTVPALDSGMTPNGIDPNGDPEPGGDSTPQPIDTGFYRVVREGIVLVGITNGMTLSGIVTIPVEIGADSGIVTTMSIQEDGTPVGDSPAIAPFSNPLHLTLDTTKMSNGLHQIYGFASWGTGGDEDSGDGTDADGDAITVNIQNEITFPNWMDYYGELYNAVLFTAESAHTNADWFVDVYGSGAGYIGTFNGHTDDGQIYFWWDLVGPPPDSITYTNEQYFDFVVTTEWSVAAPPGGIQPNANGTATAPPKRTYRQNDNWTTKGMWVIANQQAWEGMLGHDLLDIASDGFATIAEGIGLTVRPSRPAGQSFRISYGESIDTGIKTNQWGQVKSGLFNLQTRNFFYMGHGAPDHIGASENTNLIISTTEIANRLHTIPAGQTNRHGFRFVFLFGCETANGTMPESFGIFHREKVSSDDYANAGITPGTFVGWNKKEAAGIFATLINDNALYLQHFQTEWTIFGRGVNDALDHAKSGYTDVFLINRSKLKCFGNWDLTPTSFNR
jgi:hypothetical protein